MGVRMMMGRKRSGGVYENMKGFVQKYLGTRLQ